MPSNLALPPVEYCRGTTPSHAAKSRPYRYQLNTRIGKAQELLLMKGESLSTVAVATGFADQSHFTRTFKRVTGATPHEWHQNRIH
jgi:transcriptional regulator GlxA family with amidase domain